MDSTNVPPRIAPPMFNDDAVPPPLVASGPACAIWKTLNAGTAVTYAVPLKLESPTPAIVTFVPTGNPWSLEVVVNVAIPPLREAPVGAMVRSWLPFVR